MRTKLLRSFLVLLAFHVGSATFAQSAPPAEGPSSLTSGTARAVRQAHEKPPTELFEVDRVVDGDTIWVKRNGAVEKLRLLSVDTEERLGKGHAGTATKPQTVFGEETAIWAEEHFAGLAKEGEKPKVGLVFPGGKEQRDVYGRLLCHVLEPDGTDYNLLVVRLGKSPYFNKYGNDELCHDAFVAAQESARRAKFGLWNPKTNVAKTPDAPSALRPYAELLPWWDARALAVDAFRKRKAEKPESVFHAEDSSGLAAAAKLDREVEVFGEVGKTHEESNGDLTVVLRGANSEHDVRVRIAAASRKEHEALDFASLGAEFHQNYVFVRGKLASGERGLVIASAGVDRWRKAGPEPVVAREPALAK